MISISSAISFKVLGASFMLWYNRLSLFALSASCIDSDARPAPPATTPSMTSTPDMSLVVELVVARSPE